MHQKLNILCAVCSAVLLAGCAGDGTKILDDGTSTDPKWHEAESVHFDKSKGTFPNLQSLRQIRKGMTKDQLYYLIGRPQYSDGWRPRQWNYLFHFNTPGQGRGGITTCQYKVLFDKDGFSGETYWHQVSPEDGVCPPDLEGKTSHELPADTLFKFDRSDFNGISGPAEEQLSRVIKDIKSYRDLENVTIYGYTDRLGSNSYNSVLSHKRAETIKAYLVQHGIPTDKITAIGRGPSDPKVSCDEVKGAELKDCLRPNRRVEILIKGTR